MITSTDREGHVNPLTVAQQRALAEAQAKGPCFRLRMSQAEYQQLIDNGFKDWTWWPLSDGEISVWRPCSVLNGLAWPLIDAIMARKMDDDDD